MQVDEKFFQKITKGFLDYYDILLKIRNFKNIYFIIISNT